MIVAAAIWVGCLATASVPPPRDPLLDLVGLAEAVQSGDIDAAEAFKARWVGARETSPESAATSLTGLRAAEEEAHRARANPVTPLPARLTEAEAEREATRALQAGESKRALEALRASGPEGRWPPPLELLAARADHALGEEASARARWLRVAESRDRRLAAEAGIAWARSAEAAGDLEGALHRLAALTGDPQRGAEAAYLAGRLQLQHGRTDEAIERLGLAASKRHQRFSDEACWWLGWAYFGQGRAGRAAAEWEELEKGWPRSPLIAQALYWRARAQDQNGEEKQAGAIRDRLPAVAPGSYYAVLAGRANPRAGGTAPERCEPNGIEGRAAFWVAYRRAALLHGLGLPALAAAELETAGRKARGPAEAWAMAQLDSALGETGRAFSRANGSAAACIPSDWPSPPLYPRVAPSEVGSAASAVGIDPFWIDALMRRESRFEPSARSPAGAIGLLQMLPATGARIASIAGVAQPNLGAPADSIWFGAWYLGALSERFGAVFPLVAAGYDAGPTAVATWLSGDRRFDEFVEQIPFRETRAYVKEAVANLAAYQALYGAADLKISPESNLGAAPSAGGVSF